MSTHTCTHTLNAWTHMHTHTHRNACVLWILVLLKRNYIYSDEIETFFIIVRECITCTYIGGGGREWCMYVVPNETYNVLAGSWNHCLMIAWFQVRIYWIAWTTTWRAHSTKGGMDQRHSASDYIDETGLIQGTSEVGFRYGMKMQSVKAGNEICTM